MMRLTLSQDLGGVKFPGAYVATRSMRYYTTVALTQKNKARTPADLVYKSGNNDLAELLR